MNNLHERLSAGADALMVLAAMSKVYPQDTQVFLIAGTSISAILSRESITPVEAAKVVMTVLATGYKPPEEAIKKFNDETKAKAGEILAKLMASL